MKTLFPKHSQYQMALSGFLGLALLSLSQSSALALAQNGVEANLDATRSSAPVPRFSPGIPEILKMIDAKVDIEVIKAYIKNSLVAYNPQPSEIIALKDRGVPNEVLTVLIQRGGELRAQAPAQPARAPAIAPPYDSGTPYVYGSQPGMPYETAYPDYGYSYPSYPSLYSYYSYGYPYYGYSSWYWPSFYFGYYPYHGYHHYGYGYGYGHHYSGYGNHFNGHSHGIQASGSSHVGGFGGQPWAAAGGSMHSFGGGGRNFTSMGHMGTGGGFRSGGSVARGGGGGGFRGGGGAHGH